MYSLVSPRFWRLVGGLWLLVLLPLRAALAQASPVLDSAAHAGPRPLVAAAPDSLRARSGCTFHQLLARPVVRQVAVPAALLGLAVLGTEKVDLMETDEMLRSEVHKYVRIRTQLDDQLRHVPAYATLSLSLLGVKGEHSPLNQALLFGLTYTINNTITSQLKHVTHVERPRGNSFDSFPSQHTSAAFSAATFMHREYGGRSIWYSVGGYTVAAATGGLRIAKDNHWLSDVMAGAGVGIASAELAYWMYPWLHRQLTKGLGDRAIVVPSYLNGATGATVVVML